ncbi:MAG: TonB-dependent receptor [Chitinophagaceae bacterium]|nr:MAG: TonB-dependent receptor [Chitinophagaceae bacterium]
MPFLHSISLSFLTFKKRKMKRIALTGCLFMTAIATFAQTTTDSIYALTPVEVRSIRAGEKAPFAKTNLGKSEIRKLNIGQDIPFLLNMTPSVVVNSDAGAGVGYTGLRIRGTDATRINITVNGIPFNDAESQGSFFVNMPDIVSSVNSIQVQRGVGTSSNGTGAFGATVSLSTNETNRLPYAELNNSFGSFSTWKNTVKAGTGLIDGHFTVDARLSRISSDGFIDRASSDLQAFYLSGAWLTGKSTLRFNVFSGKEKTFQAWNGVPEAKLKGDNDALLTHYYNNLGSIYHTPEDSANLFSSNKNKYNLPLYKNETDNYRQTHYQLFYDLKVNDRLSVNLGTFLTRGLGYYENYKYGEDFADYGLPDLSIDGTPVTSTDLVRQKWLDNYFYGQIASLQYRSDKDQLALGGGWTSYDGDHYGIVTWAKYGFSKDQHYYDNTARKNDLNIYAKWQHQLNAAWSFFADLQYRRVKHTMDGFEDNPTLAINRSFDFVNPKAGITYTRNGWQAFISYARASKEPNRADFEAGLVNQPQKETLHDFEGSVEKRWTKAQLGLTLYYMHYTDQLVLTGKVNDVGAYTRVNVPSSYRSGIELQGAYFFSNKVNISGNLTLSRNKVKAFTEFLDEYNADFDWIGQYTVDHRNTDIAFSPSTTGAAMLNILPVKNLELSFISKYVGKQYLDNTESNSKKLDAFYTQDVRLGYTFSRKIFNEWSVVAQVNNVFNKQYQPNGYTYGYIYDGSLTTENFYFPMAGTNYMLSLNIRL